MKNLILLLYIVITGCLEINTLPAQTIFVPLNNPVYDFIERMETRGILTRVLNGTKPMTRVEVAHLLHKLATTTPALNRVEMAKLAFFISEFKEDLPDPVDTRYSSRLTKIVRHPKIDRFVPDFFYRNGRNFIALEHDQFRFFLDPKLSRKRTFATADTLDRRERIFEDANGLMLWGTLGRHLGYFVDMRDTREWGSRPYPDQYEITITRYGFVNGYGSHIYHDETVSYVNFSWRWLELQFGKDSNRWGPGYRGQLALSDYATSYDLLKFQIRYWHFKLTGLTGFLRHYPRAWINGERRDRTLAAHRLEFSPVRGLDLGLHETVVYFDPQFELSYLNPVNFYRAQEHYLGDQGNVGMGLDFELLRLPKTKLYGEFFLDDMTSGKLGTGWRGNKYGYSLGMFHTDVVGIANLDLRLEFTRVRPYTYSHRDSLNVYKHFSTGLGHRIGPNSENLYLGLIYQPHWRITLTVDAEQLRHGANEPGLNVGGAVDVPHMVPAPEYIDLLDGLVTTTQSFQLTGCYQLLRFLFLRGRLAYLSANRDRRDYLTWTRVNRTEIEAGFDVNF